MADAEAHAEVHVEGQQHPIGIYLQVWGWLFVLSTFSYLVDYFHLEGYLRWTLILVFMALKAGLIIAVFMHMMWERLALMYAICLPPVFGDGVYLSHDPRSGLHLLHAGRILRGRTLGGISMQDPAARREACS